MRVPVCKSHARGFSLVELLIVVAVILAIAAIAAVNMLRARMKANEAAAVANMRTINIAEAMYATAYPEAGYAGSLADLGSHGSNCETPGKSNACLIMDDALTSGLKGGYTFELLGDGRVPTQAYTLTALPVSSGTSGSCSFTSNQSDLISAASTGGGGPFSMATSKCDLGGGISPSR